MQVQPQEYKNCNVSEDNPTMELTVDVEQNGESNFDGNLESDKNTTSLEDAGSQEAVKVEEDRKNGYLETKKHEDKPGLGQVDVHCDGQAGVGHQHCVGRVGRQGGPLVMHGRAPTAGKLAGKMEGSPAKVHSIRGISGTNRTN